MTPAKRSPTALPGGVQALRILLLVALGFAVLWAVLGFTATADDGESADTAASAMVVLILTGLGPLIASFLIKPGGLYKVRLCGMLTILACLGAVSVDQFGGLVVGAISLVAYGLTYTNDVRAYLARR